MLFMLFTSILECSLVQLLILFFIFFTLNWYALRLKSTFVKEVKKSGVTVLLLEIRRIEDHAIVKPFFIFRQYQPIRGSYIICDKISVKFRSGKRTELNTIKSVV